MEALVLTNLAHHRVVETRRVGYDNRPGSYQTMAEMIMVVSLEHDGVAVKKRF